MSYTTSYYPQGYYPYPPYYPYAYYPYYYSYPWYLYAFLYPWLYPPYGGGSHHGVHGPGGGHHGGGYPGGGGHGGGGVGSHPGVGHHAGGQSGGGHRADESLYFMPAVTMSPVAYTAPEGPIVGAYE